MRRGTTVPLALVCLSVTVAGLAVAAPRWTRASGLDFWNFGTEKARLQAATEERRELDESCASLQQRVEAMTERMQQQIAEMVKRSQSKAQQSSPTN